MNNILAIENLYCNYNQIIALQDISIKIQKNSIVALVGANGAGKTTLLKTISDLHSPKKGQIFFNNQNITKLKSNKRVKLGIAHVPEGRGLFTTMNVEENILLGAYSRSDKEIKDDIKNIYKQFPILEEKKKEYAGTLSGGQQQMVAVARALMSRPKLLLLDEPSMGLAPIIVEEIFATIKKLKNLGTTVFLVEQNANLALKISDYAYVLENGKIALRGDSDKLLNDQKVKEAYLGA